MNGSATSSSCRPWPAASSGCSAATSPISSAGGACSPGASCSTPSARSRPAIPRRSQWLLFWRCCTFVGVCVEFVAAVAWLAELFPNPKQREAIIGYTQALGSLGGVAATGAYYLIVTYGEHLPAVRGGHEAWRYTADVGRHPGAAPDPDPAVSPGVADLAAEEDGRHAQAAEHRRAVPAAVPHDDHRHDGDDGVRLRGRVRRHPTDAAHRARPGRSANAGAAGAGADHQRRPVVSGIWRAGRPIAPGVSGGPHRRAGAGCFVCFRCPA